LKEKCTGNKHIDIHEVSLESVDEDRRIRKILMCRRCLCTIGEPFYPNGIKILSQINNLNKKEQLNVSIPKQ
jgi:hypothetical protein